MKFKHLLFSILVVSFFAVSCSSDDDDTSNATDNQLIGTWTITNLTFDGSVAGEGLNFSGQSEDLGDNITLNFGEDHKFTAVADSIPIQFSLTDAEGTATPQNAKATHLFEDGTWKLDDNILTLTSKESNKETQYIINDDNFSKAEMVELPQMIIVLEDGSELDMSNFAALVDDFSGTITAEPTK